ncbi:hypothetical protein V1273_002909 [Bradyrhizobium sp. AZCC 1721]
MSCVRTSVFILSCAQPHLCSVTRRRRPTAKGPLQLSPSRPIAAALSERRAYCSGVSVVEEDIADQRSSKLAVGSSFASTVRPFDMVVPAETAMLSVEGECDLMVAADAATASRATATNPVIVRCFVIRTSCGPESPLGWVRGTSRRFNGKAKSVDCVFPQIGQLSCPEFKLLTRHSCIGECPGFSSGAFA